MRQGSGVYLRGGTWWLDFRHQGKRHIVKIGSFKNKSAAVELANVERVKILRGERGIGPKRERVTLDEFVESLKGGIASKLKPWAERLAKRTLAGYTQYLRLYISPSLGKVALEDITWKQVLTLLQKLEVNERLGHNTLVHVRACLSTILTDAVSCDLLSLNPLLGQQRKANRKHRQETVDVPSPLNEEEMARFEETIRRLRATGWRLRSPYAVLFLVQPHCGLRPSEARALKVTDIDFIGKRLWVERAMEDGDKEVKPCKTYEQRWVDLNSTILRYLEEYVTWLKAEAIAAGHSAEWLFPSEQWTFIAYRNSARAFYTVCAEAHLSGRSQYDLRHTYASLLLSKCAAPGYVQKQMGHKTLDMTLRVYANYVKAGDVRYCELICGTTERSAEDKIGLVFPDAMPKADMTSGHAPRNHAKVQAGPRSSVG